MHVSLPRPGELLYRIWDQVAIWDRRLIPSSQKSGMKMSQTSPASRRILWHLSASEVVVAEKMIHPTSTRGKLLISAVTHSDVHLCCHRPDHFAGHSFVACPFADHPFPHVYVKLLASLLPPSTRQPGPVAVLLGQTLKLTLIFSPISHSLGSTEKRLGAAEINK